MNSTKYIGVDVHKEATTIAVMNPAGKLVMESIVETKAATIVQFLEGLRGELYVTFEEGTWAAWLYDLLKRHVTKVAVCNPRKIPYHLSTFIGGNGRTYTSRRPARFRRAQKFVFSAEKTLRPPT